MNFTELFVGISAMQTDRGHEVAIAIRDAVYLMDIVTWSSIGGSNAIVDEIVANMRMYNHKHETKFLGAGVPLFLSRKCPLLSSRLWRELDIVPFVIPNETRRSDRWNKKYIDEQADSMARKCITYFGPSGTPALQVGWHSEVDVTAGRRICLSALEDYRKTCSKMSWESLEFYANKLRVKGTKVAFFSATPQGGGVALMRHALVRLAALLGLDVKWYVPKPRANVFRITKNMHNVLQGVTAPDQHIPPEDMAAVIQWNNENANRYWLEEGGPLQSPEDGGADIIIVDDPQMIALVAIAKRVSKERPVLFRLHIQVRSDLVATPGTPQARVWDFIWRHIEEADAFITHPISAFAPQNVPHEKVLYLPATSDWLDGLNKSLSNWDTRYYIHKYNTQCYAQRMTGLNWPLNDRKYIIQVARFDPAKGIPTVVHAYAEFRRLFTDKRSKPPQLIICGNGSIDDPDGSRVYNEVVQKIRSEYASLEEDISVMRLGPCDQLLNALLANAHVVLQLSTVEGFEVKVTEALHAGRPVIGSTVGGIPLQIQNGVNGYLVEPGDWRTVGTHLARLFTDDKLHADMCAAARASVCDETSTVGNALAWCFLVSSFTSGRLHGNGRWVSDLAREAAGKPYTTQENHLPRNLAL